jgi:hypothetical protein
LVGIGLERCTYVINLDEPDRGVVSVDLTSSGWGDAESLNMLVEQFIASIDGGTFNPFGVE